MTETIDPAIGAPAALVLCGIAIYQRRHAIAARLGRRRDDHQ